ncbi:uncharacterized protein LOC134654552 [Cydia amplana]|uniref:uncharacterized protein LOC134654552 n=1 Tax=Cydia amplana TaxID=1869771 RepID=UPI002FE5B614
MVNTRRNVKKEREKQELDMKRAEKEESDVKQLTKESTDENSKKNVKEFDKTYVAPDPGEGTSKMFLNPADKEPQHPSGSRCSNRSKSKNSPSFKSTLLDERKNLKIKAAEELARIQSELVQKKLAADLAALEEKYSHISSSKSSEKKSNGSEIVKWIDQGQQVLQQAREEGDVTSRPPAPAANDPEATVSMLAQALKDLTASTCKQNNNLISRLSTPRELPTFSGDAMEWLNFKQSFDESTELCNYSTKENMWRLRKCLVGAAREAVAALLTSGSSPDTIIATLQLQFGNPELIINKIMNDIKKIPALPQDYIGDLVKFSIKIKNFMAAVKTLNRDEYLKGVSICTIVLSKLPTALLTKWSDYYYKQKEIKGDIKLNKLELLSQFLSEEATKITESGISLLNMKQINYSADKSGFKQHAVCTTSQQTEKCKFCKLSPHSLLNCRLFKKSLRKERWNFVRNNGICFKCLSADHDKDTCQAPMCDKDGCAQPHHALLHYPINKQAPKQVHAVDVIAEDKEVDQMEPEEDSQSSQPESETASENSIVANVSDNNNKVFLKVVRVNVHGPKGVITTHAFLDDGSAISLISENVVNRVGLTGKTQNLHLRGAWNSGEILCKSELVDLKISNVDNECFELRARKMAELNIPVQKLSKINIKNYEHLSELNNYYYQNTDVKPELLIGQDYYHLIMPLKIISRERNEPCATLTVLGWCVHGPINQAPSKQRTASDILLVSRSPARAHRSLSLAPGKLGASPVINEAGRLTYDNSGLPGASAHAAPASTCASAVLPPAEQTCFDESAVLFIDASELADNYNADVLLHETVRNYFNLESVGVTSKKRENKEEQHAISILNDTAKLKNGRWEVGLPWKSEEKLVESYSTAERRLKSVEKRLRSNEEYASRYRERIRHLFENDYAREVKPEESGNRIWVIPHFGVDNPRKKKLRLVFDCASISHGKCLNDYLLQGPDLLNSLYGIMLRFRENPIGITGDIRDMFLRIKIREEDQHALRFLWRDSQDQPIKQYVMTSLLFGGNCSPFIAQFIRDKNAQQFIETKPNAVRAIMHSHYVDDFIDSLPTESEAINIIDDVSTVHKFGGFEIRGWTSNNKNVLSHLPKDQLSTNGESLLVDGENKTQRTLGLLWDPSQDTLAVDVSLKNIPEDILEFKKMPTKREILRITMSIYDIFGILAPVTIKGKILLKSIWKTALSWDDKISEELYIEFKHWITDLKSVVHLNIPRWYFTTSANFITSAKETTSILELHMFCDAAPTAFAAVAYWRLVSANGDVCVSLIACKNKISSMKRLSIPRSELESALIAARLAKTIKDEHRRTGEDSPCKNKIPSVGETSSSHSTPTSVSTAEAVLGGRL